MHGNIGAREAFRVHLKVFAVYLEKSTPSHEDMTTSASSALTVNVEVSCILHGFPIQVVKLTTFAVFGARRVVHIQVRHSVICRRHVVGYV